MRIRAPFALAAATVAFWVVPSLGTQGMGTIGQQVVHPDAALVDTIPADRAAAAAVLARADEVAEDALGL